MVYEIIYTSAAARLPDPGELSAILETARRNNQRLAVTGILLYASGSFLQVLEGDEAVVRELYERIAGDGRHYRVRMLRERMVASRSFGTWSMGFVALEARLRGALPAGSHALSSNGSLSDDAQDLLALLDAFRDGQHRSYILG
jgi:hypothetical protein